MSTLTSLFREGAKQSENGGEILSPEAENAHLNLIMLGHVDAGKTTVMGHLLRLAGAITAREARDWAPVASDMSLVPKRPRR